MPKYPPVSILLLGVALSVSVITDAHTQVVQASVMSSGGGRTTGSGYTMISTLGQPATGIASGSSASEQVGFWYALDNAVVSTGAEAEAPNEFIPSAFALGDIYPNPTGRTSTVQFDLPEPAHVRVEVYDVRGRLVELALDTARPAGRHVVTLQASGWSSGTYVVRISADDFVDNRVLQVVR